MFLRLIRESTGSCLTIRMPVEITEEEVDQYILIHYAGWSFVCILANDKGNS